MAAETVEGLAFPGFLNCLLPERCYIISRLIKAAGHHLHIRGNVTAEAAAFAGVDRVRVQCFAEGERPRKAAAVDADLVRVRFVKLTEESSYPFIAETENILFRP